MKKYKPQKKYVRQIFIKIYFNVRQKIFLEMSDKVSNENRKNNEK